ncbi:MAG: hypothetical protein IT372_33040 [Polyangiaceae bacterium]|nr:hypothetical protein [Polyangiaceae bacterium]
MIPSSALRWAPILVLPLAGCAAAAPPPTPPPRETQTFAEAVKMLCDVDTLAGLSPDEDPIAIGQRRTEWLADRIENPDGIYFKTILSVKGAEDQAAAMRDEARKMGLPRCALADSIEQHSGGGLSP